MDKTLLSLKNIYRLFMVQDFPVYSEAVFSERNRRGMTLVKFWQTYLAEDFRMGKYGKMMWRSEGKRNRHISAVINRTGTQSAYVYYEEECVRLLTVSVLKRQQELFEDFLKSREFSSKAFLWKLDAYLSRLEEDPYFNRASGIFLKKYYRKIEEHLHDEGNCIFYSAWMLTMLTVFALAGSKMETLTKHPCLIHPFTEMTETGEFLKKNKKELRFLTKQTGAFGRSALQRQHFFGRETELFELRQMVIRGGHYLISGMGGIGKTELLRQLLQVCAEENLCDAAALISYENNMAMSFVTAFGKTGDTSLNQRFMEILGDIRRLKNTRVLILIDNIEYTVLKDEGIREILDLPATVIATSRVKKISGFKTFEVKSISADAGNLVFRDHYMKKMTEEDKAALSQILSIESSRHPLTLRFLGRAACYGNYSVRELKEQFTKDSGQIFIEGKTAAVFLQQIYEHIYQLNNLSHEAKYLLDIYTKLPYKTYSAGFIQAFFMAPEESDVQVKRRLTTLCWLGFLEQSENGFAMHPFIAECLGKRGDEFEAEDVFFERVLEQLDSSIGGIKAELSKNLACGMLMDAFAKSPEIGEICRILLHYEKKMHRHERSVRQIGILLLAIEAAGRIYGFSEDMYMTLAHFRKTYQKLPLSYRLRCLVMEAYNSKMPSEEYEKVFDEYGQKWAKDASLKELYEYFCVSYIETLRHDGKFERAQQLCKDFYSKIENVRLKIEISRHMTAMLLNELAYSKVLHWLNESEKLLEPVSDIGMYREFLMQKGRYYFSTEQWVAFQKVQEELCASIKESDIRWQYEFFYWKGMMEFTKNENVQAVTSLKAALEYAGAYFGKAHKNTAYVDMALGVCYCNMQQYEEAYFYTQEGYDIFASYPSEQFMSRRLKNNIGYLKMKMGKFDEAYACFMALYNELVSKEQNPDTEITEQIRDNLAQLFQTVQNKGESENTHQLSDEGEN